MASLRDWKHEITAAREYQKRDGRLMKWKKYRGWFRNKFPTNVVSVNLVFGIGRSLVPQLYFKAPTILVRPRKPQAMQQAKILEAADSWLIEHIGLKYAYKHMILDAFLTDIGVGKCGYHSIATELPAPTLETIPEMAELLGAREAELVEELEQRRWSYHDYIRPDTPWFLRVRPEDVLVPWGFMDEHEAPWVAFRVMRPIADVKHDPVYGNVKALQPNVVPDFGSDAVISPNMREVTSRGEFVEMFEIWDKRDGFIRVLSMDHDKWLREEEHELNIKGIPGVVLRFNPDGEDFWGVPDVEQIHKQVIELNENRTHEIVTKRLANVKGLLNKNAIDSEEIDKLTAGHPGPFVMTNESPQGQFTTWAPSVPPDLWRVDEVIRQDIREIVGFSRVQQGEFTQGRKTAHEVEAVREAFMLRADERRDLVADSIAELFRDKIHPMIFQYWTAERMIQVTALGGWVTFTGDQIKGDYDVTVVPDSVLPVSKQMEQQMTLSLFEMFRGDLRVKQRELYARVLQGFQQIIPDPETMLEDERVVQQAMQQQAMIAALQAGPGKRVAAGK